MSYSRLIFEDVWCILRGIRVRWKNCMAITCYLLSPRGFCSGVFRAVDMAQQMLKMYGTIYITEDIIHNNVFMEQLKKKGVIKVDSLDDIPDGSVFMFSAHGVSPQVIAKAEEKELTIIDGTCQIVKTIQQAAKKEADLGRKIILIGNRSHAEIIALLGYAGNKGGYVVFDEIDIDLLPDFANDEVVYFTQTTLDTEVVDSIVKKLKEKIPHIKSIAKDNVCYATKERQEAVRHIASKVDLVIVLGAAHSSNANRLREVAISAGAPKAILIDSKEGLLEHDMEGVNNIAITAAASTPEDVVKDLLVFLENKFDIEVKEFNPYNVQQE